VSQPGPIPCRTLKRDKRITVRKPQGCIGCQVGLDGLVEFLEGSNNDRRWNRVINHLIWKKGIQTLCPAKEHFSINGLEMGDRELVALQAIADIVVPKCLAARVKVGYALVGAQPQGAIRSCQDAIDGIIRQTILIGVTGKCLSVPVKAIQSTADGPDPDYPFWILENIQHQIAAETGWGRRIISEGRKTSRFIIEKVDPSQRTDPQDTHAILGDAPQVVIAQTGRVVWIVKVMRKRPGSLIEQVQASILGANPQPVQVIFIKGKNTVAAQAAWIIRAVLVTDKLSRLRVQAVQPAMFCPDPYITVMVLQDGADIITAQTSRISGDVLVNCHHARSTVQPVQPGKERTNPEDIFLVLINRPNVIIAQPIRKIRAILE
jgi:hypothetical protein